MNFAAKSALSSKNFFKLKNGESVAVVFVGEPYDFKQHWINQKPSLCTQNSDCPQCKRGNKPSFRFRLNGVVREGEEYVCKIWEGGWTIYENLMVINGEYPLEKTALKITRKGDGTDTTYPMIPARESLNEAALEKIA